MFRPSLPCIGTLIICLSIVSDPVIAQQEEPGIINNTSQVFYPEVQGDNSVLHIKDNVATALRDPLIPTDPLFRYQWSLHNVGYVVDHPEFATKYGADGGVVDAWRRMGNRGSSQVTIAVVDHGFDKNHVDFEGKVTATLDANTGSTYLPAGPGSGSHGTACASVAAGAANGAGMVGVAPESSLILIDGLSFSPVVTERVFQFAVDQGADIISCSWGTTLAMYSPGAAQVTAIKGALIEGRKGKGAIVVFAAGNEGLDYVNYYGQIPGVITVGASTSSDELADYTNTGRGISVVAPSNGGWPVLAARPWWDVGVTTLPYNQRYYRDGINRSPEHKHFGGTSSATAYVSGVCALILSVNPELTNVEVKLLLEQTADKIGDPAEYDARGYSLRYGYGRVNADKAVARAQELLRMVPGRVRRYEVIDTSITDGGMLLLDSIPELPWREVKVKDPASKKRYWLVYQRQEELMALRELKFEVIKTRPLKKQADKNWWKRRALDIFLKFGIEQLEDVLKR